jgi:DNA-binding NtrC family response regulator
VSGLIFVESQPRWASAFRLIVPKSGLKVRSAPHWPSAMEQLKENRDQLVCVEVSPNNATSLLPLTRQSLRDCPHLRCVALIDRSQTDCEGMLREYGFVDVIQNFLELDRLTHLAERHHELTPPVDITWQQAIWQKLPWKAVGLDRRLPRGLE